jgi:hypothetical protein
VGAFNLPAMTDGLSILYQDLLGGSYDCDDRIVLNAFFPMGHDPGGFRVWWRALTGSDRTHENAYLMRLAGRFSRRVRGYAKTHRIPLIDRLAAQRKHELAEQNLARRRSRTVCFLFSSVGQSAGVGCQRQPSHRKKETNPLDREWGHLTIRISGHPPFPAQVILNGQEYVACRARQSGYHIM